MVLLRRSVARLGCSAMLVWRSIVAVLRLLLWWYLLICIVLVRTIVGHCLGRKTVEGRRSRIMWPRVGFLVVTDR